MKKNKPPHYWHEAKKFLSKKDKKLAKIINQYDGHLVTRNDPFYSLCRSIIGQQISVKAADSIWLKFEKVIKKITPTKQNEQLALGKTTSFLRWLRLTPTVRSYCGKISWNKPN